MQRKGLMIYEPAKPTIRTKSIPEENMILSLVAWLLV